MLLGTKKFFFFFGEPSTPNTKSLNNVAIKKQPFKKNVEIQKREEEVVKFKKLML